MAQVAGGWSLSAYCVPQVVQMDRLPDRNQKKRPVAEQCTAVT
jgi:hypothetical protein